MIFVKTGQHGTDTSSGDAWLRELSQSSESKESSTLGKNKKLLLNDSIEIKKQNKTKNPSSLTDQVVRGISGKTAKMSA